MAVCGRFPATRPLLPTTLLVELAEVVREAADVLREEPEETPEENDMFRGPAWTVVVGTEFTERDSAVGFCRTGSPARWASVLRFVAGSGTVDLSIELHKQWDPSTYILKVYASMAEVALQMFPQSGRYFQTRTSRASPFRMLLFGLADEGATHALTERIKC